MGLYRGDNPLNILIKSVGSVLISLRLQSVIRIHAIKNLINKLGDYAQSKFASFLGDKFLENFVERESIRLLGMIDGGLPLNILTLALTAFGVKWGSGIFGAIKKK